MARVLVAEDEFGIALLVRRILEQQGHKVQVAVDGQKAVEALNASQYDLLITDIKMPFLNGIQLVDWAKKQFPLLPVLIISAHLEESESALAAGAVTFLMKPFTRDQLLNMVGQHINTPMRRDVQ
jgi:CheY-like chemotaxis protein